MQKGTERGPSKFSLRPCSFIIYINHLAASLHCQYNIFADDLKIYMKVQACNSSLLLSNIAIFQQDIDVLNESKFLDLAAWIIVPVFLLWICIQ